MRDVMFFKSNSGKHGKNINVFLILLLLIEQMAKFISKTNIVVALIGLAGVIISALITAKYTKNKPSSAIYGGQENTIINSENGTVNLSGGISKQEVIDALGETIDDLQKTESTEREIERLKNRLSKIHSTSLGSIPEEADKWAESFVASLPIRKDKVDEQQRKNKKREDFINESIPYLFEYMISFVDQRTSALSSKLQGVEVEKTDLTTYYIGGNKDNSANNPNVCVRKVQFQNGNGFEVLVQLGEIENDIIKRRPRFIWYRSNCSKDCSKFELWGECYGGFSPPACYLSFINDDLKIEIDRLNHTLSTAFDRLAQNVILVK